MLLIASLVSYLTFASVTSAATDPGYNCRPGQKCWPSSREWRKLNQTIDGHLYQTIPMGAPCYGDSTHHDSGACNIVESDYNNSVARVNYFGQTYWANWEACGSSSCSLLSSDPDETLYSACSLGRLATYYVDVREPSHISATLQFAQAHNIRISIKNTGHDFFGRSMMPNSLAIWTHNLKSLDFHETFTASNCPSANGKNVGEMGAGVIAGDAYRYFNSHGMDVTGGYEQSVGIAGGFGQGGGFGEFTTSYGLMVDNAVEFEVVTADGELRVINQCNDPELFWAMRGGGGGTYAVLTKYRAQLYPFLPIHTYKFAANLTAGGHNSNATQKKALRDILTAHANNQVEWSAQKVTGQVDYRTDVTSFGFVLPYGDDGSKLKSATASFAQLVNNMSDITVLANSYVSYANYSEYLAVSAADAEKTEPPGIFSLLASRLMPRDLFTTPESVTSLVDGVIEGLEKATSLLGFTALQVVFESPVSHPDSNHATSIHPAMRTALWSVIHVGRWDEPLPPAAVEKATSGFLQILDPLKELTPGGGAYLNEAHFGEPDWEDVFFGPNYDRLLEIKNQYDPTHIFDCWKCVGWRGEQDPFYSCWQNDNSGPVG